MKRVHRRLLFVLLAALGLAGPLDAHVGSKDIFEQISAGPYKLFVVIRTPNVIPGVATIEVRTSGPTVSSIRVTPIPLAGEASHYPPTSDLMQRSGVDPAFFTGSLWLMESGSWQVRFEVAGAAGSAIAGVPIPAMPISILRMQRPLGLMLTVLGLILAVGMAGIVDAAVRQSRLRPGLLPSPERRRQGRIAGVVTLVVVSLVAYAGDRWWNVEAAIYATDIYHPLSLRADLSGNRLDLMVGIYNPGQLQKWRARSNNDLLPDHSQPMHLYAIRQPGMDAVFHLHPQLVSPGDLRITLPTMPAGSYKLYADIVHANGFPETLTANLTVPANLPPSSLGPEDASATPPALWAGKLGPSYTLPDGYKMVGDCPIELTARTAFYLRFRLLDRLGQPASDMQPYLGMAGHAAFVKADGTTFAHTHPDGSAAMPALMLANGGASALPEESRMSGMEKMSPVASLNAPTAAAAPAGILPTVDFPYGFPSPGRYRIFIQMKHAGTIETGVFDADVH